MKVIHVKRSGPLTGDVPIQGSKNAVLPILAATILIKGVCVLKNCPGISDVNCMLNLIESLGCKVKRKKEELIIDTTPICESRLPGELVTCMRSSVMLLGPLLAVCKETTMNYPGGCVIGERPIDIHLQVLEKMGASFILMKDSVRGKAPVLTGTEISMRFPSVGATENGIMAAVLAKGTTILKNCAKEPEIQQLCCFLNKAGARIHGIGESELRIEGVEKLQPVCYSVEPDRIVAGTYLLSVAATGGKARLINAPVHDMQAVISVGRKLGCDITVQKDGLVIIQNERIRAIPYIKTMIYPGFPTDLQSVLIAALAVSDGESVVEETIFSNRFRIVDELMRMGADISVSGNRARIRGVGKLKGRHVVAEDLRGGAALILAGILAEGGTVVNNCHYIERGYEDICRDYRMLGACAESIGLETV